MPTPTPSIQIEHVTKSFRLAATRPHGFKETLLHLPKRVFHPNPPARRFVAVDDVSLQVEPGECFGLVGANGSGKSTLLSIMAGVYRPERGRVRLRGRVCPLLELGAGFHPELTGRENVMLNGVLLGMTRREVRRLYHEIIEFAELGEFIEQPIRTYSSGMVARLGFSVAAHLKPQVLLLDEVMSVGDVRFAAKCEGKFDEFIAAGATIVLVTHAPDAVRRYCCRCAWLSHGGLMSVGDCEEVLGAYEEAMQT